MVMNGGHESKAQPGLRSPSGIFREQDLAQCPSCLQICFSFPFFFFFSFAPTPPNQEIMIV